MRISDWSSDVCSSDLSTAALSSAFFRLTDYPPEDRAHVPSEDIDVHGGRKLHVPKALKGVAVFSFKRLCAEARGAPDYLAIARKYHTVIIRSEEHTSELQSLLRISYAVFCLKKKKHRNNTSNSLQKS